MLKFLRSIRIWKEKPGVISSGSSWCLVYGGCYLHVCDSLPQLLLELITEFRSEKHLVGH